MESVLIRLAVECSKYEPVARSPWPLEDSDIVLDLPDVPFLRGRTDEAMVGVECLGEADMDQLSCLSWCYMSLYFF